MPTKRREVSHGERFAFQEPLIFLSEGEAAPPDPIKAQIDRARAEQKEREKRPRRKGYAG